MTSTSVAELQRIPLLCLKCGSALRYRACSVHPMQYPFRHKMMTIMTLLSHNEEKFPRIPEFRHGGLFEFLSAVTSNGNVYLIKWLAPTIYRNSY